MKRVLVIGDVMLDKYIETTPVRISDEAPVMIVKETEVSYILGGAGNTAANLKAMGFDVTLQGIVGSDEAGYIVKKLLAKKDIVDVVIEAVDFKTTVKKRILCKGRQVIRVDSEYLTLPINPLLDDPVDVIVISDYAKGTIGDDTIKILKENYDVPIIVNGKPKNIRYYMGADIVVLNKKEADEVLVYLRSTYNPEPSYIDIAGYFNILYVVITKGEEGIEVYDSKDLRYKVLANKVEVKDITGAGDTVTAALTLEIVNSGNIAKAIMLANLAGGIKVSKDKTAEVSLKELSLEEINPEDIGRISPDLNSERLDG